MLIKTNQGADKLIPQLRFPEFDGLYDKKSFNDVFTFSTGKNIKQNEASPDFETPCVRYGELYHMYKEVITKVINRTNLDETELTFSEGNEVLLPSAGEDPLDIGSASALTIADIAIGRTINVLRPIESGVYSNVYAAYYISEKLRKKISTLAKGSSISNVYNSDLKKLAIPLTSLPEQEKIASFLSAVDKKISQLTEKLALLEQYKKGVMQQIFSQQIHFKDDAGNAFPEWEEKRLKEITTINQGLQIAISKRLLEPEEGACFYITNEFLKEKSKNRYYILNPPESVVCIEEDILMTRTGNTGQVVTGVKGAFHNNFFKIKLDDSCHRWFMYYFLTFYKTQHKILTLAGSSTIPDLNHGDFYKMKIQLPCLEEQQKIADFLSAIDKKMEAVGAQLEKTQAFKKGLLQKMFV